MYTLGVNYRITQSNLVSTKLLKINFLVRFSETSHTFVVESCYKQDMVKNSQKIMKMTVVTMKRMRMPTRSYPLMRAYAHAHACEESSKQKSSEQFSVIAARRKFLARY